MSDLHIGIQGIKASFHDVAAQQFFGSHEAVECPTFKRLCEKLKNGSSDFSMMAIENTIAGSILTNYSLLEQYSFQIIGEVYLPISLCFMALPGRKIADLKFAQSHPMALFQSEEFLFRNPHLKSLEAADTAESAKDVAEKKLDTYGVIASRLAAETYGLEVLEESIETNKLNYTRFLAIARKEDFKVTADADKSSLRFETENHPGRLLKVLEVLKKYNVNLTKIQSIPILGKPYQYSIHLDAEWVQYEDYQRCVDQIKQISNNLFEFGAYRRGVRPVV